MGKSFGFKRAFLFEVAGELVAKMADIYPELKAQESLLKKCIENEEKQFLETLETGLVLLAEAIESMPPGKTILDGALAFKLYDTYGFPLDLTQIICAEGGCQVDSVGFDAAMAQQKAQSRKKLEGLWSRRN